MSNSSFTPGDWHVSELDATGEPSKYYIFVEPGVAVIERSTGGEHDMADARLIAAAPDLLEALTNLVGLAKMGAARLDKYHAALADAQAAIDKARGA
jgi:hypothetical protein